MLVGVIGGFIPVLQGWVFVLAGLGVMAPESALARRALEWLKHKLGSDGQRPGGTPTPGGSA